MDLLDLQNIANGALQEKVNAAMQKVLTNLQDPNTPWKNKRQINIKIAFTQNEERDDTGVEISVDTKLAPVSPVATRMMIGKDLKTGETYAKEYGKQVKGQLGFNDCYPEQVIGEDLVDTDTGEVVGNIKDFRAKEA